LAGLAVLLFIPSESKRLMRIWANLAAFAGFLVSLPLVSRFRADVSGFQFEERASWIPTLGVNYHIGIDGISLLLLMLTTLVGSSRFFLLERGSGPASRDTTPCSCCCRRA